MILIRPPGAGKGTQAHTLATQLGVAHISTGDLFRRHVGSRTVLGERLKRSWSGGELVADEITLETVRDCLTKATPPVTSWSTTSPAPSSWPCSCNSSSGNREPTIDAVLEMHVGEDEIVRHLGRRTCRECGRSWHVEFNPPHVEGSCDACGSALARDQRCRHSRP
ncbi:nucleoside monophosphate kinase [Saccharopolyspora sp. ASAGF58]|uniref:adenylate kinase family protein n=1 Tax=Saccharopolyspora sp. ASAGF58 TaxID=2719023 RepID=UPI00143FDA95|nr:adenylate kinase [Saccharopolyspora sp. ASAGF58]